MCWPPFLLMIVSMLLMIHQTETHCCRNPTKKTLAAQWVWQLGSISPTLSSPIVLHIYIKYEWHVLFSILNVGWRSRVSTGGIHFSFRWRNASGVGCCRSREACRYHCMSNNRKQKCTGRGRIISGIGPCTYWQSTSARGPYFTPQSPRPPGKSLWG